MHKDQTIQLREILLTLMILAFLAHIGKLPPIFAQSGVKGSVPHRRALLDHRAEPSLSHLEFVRLLRALDLDAKQRHEIRAIIRRYESSNGAQRNELRRLDDAETRQDSPTDVGRRRARELRETLRQDSEQMQTKVKAVLTAEQRTRLVDLMSNQNKRPNIRKSQDRRTDRGEFHRARDNDVPQE